MNIEKKWQSSKILCAKESDIYESKGEIAADFRFAKINLSQPVFALQNETKLGGVVYFKFHV